MPIDSRSGVLRKVLRSPNDGALSDVLCNLDGDGAPTVNDDVSDGYSPGSVWLDITSDPKASYRCLDNSVGAAVWIITTLAADDLTVLALNEVDTLATLPAQDTPNDLVIVADTSDTGTPKTATLDFLLQGGGTLDRDTLDVTNDLIPIQDATDSTRKGITQRELLLGAALQTLDNITVTYSPSNYSTANTLLTSHLAGIDAALAQVFRNVTTETVPYTVNSALDSVLLVDGTGALTLPAPATVSGQLFTVKLVGAGAVDVTPAAGTIDGDPSYPLTSLYEAIEVVSDGTNYLITDLF